MPEPIPVMNQGQTVALLLAAAGVALLWLALTPAGRSRPGTVCTRARSALVGALMMTAGLVLLLVRRLDPAALSRVLANVMAALVAAAMAERRARWLATSDPLDRRHGRRVDVICTKRSPHELSEELS